MIEIELELKGGMMERTCKGEVWNESALAARSDYGWFFEGRSQPDGALLRQYPRWCEPVTGLVARCLALSRAQASDALAPRWEQMVVKIALRPGGKGYRLLDTVQLSRDAGGLKISSIPASGEAHLKKGIASRARYADLWDLAEHALRLSTFGKDELPAPQALDVPIHRQGSLSFVCTRDIPEPARSVFEERMKYSACPVIPGFPDAVYSWDWSDFLAGGR
jgi:hypothetical protein